MSSKNIQSVIKNKKRENPYFTTSYLTVQNSLLNVKMAKGRTLIYKIGQNSSEI